MLVSGYIIFFGSGRFNKFRTLLFHLTEILGCVFGVIVLRISIILLMDDVVLGCWLEYYSCDVSCWSWIFLWCFYGFYHGIHHQSWPPFGRTVLGSINWNPPINYVMGCFSSRQMKVYEDPLLNIYYHMLDHPLQLRQQPQPHSKRNKSCLILFW